MPSSLIWLVVSQLVIYMLVFLGIRQMRRRARARDGETQSSLTETLLDQDQTVEHRIDAVTRQAQDELQECILCAFANFQRHRYCSLCGTSLSRTLSSIYNENTVLSRQRRARRRHDWIRKLDVEGNCYWYRTPISSDDDERNDTSVTAGICLSAETFVVQFRLEARDEPECSAVDVSSRRSTAVEALAAETSRMKLELRDPSPTANAPSIDPSTSPLGTSLQPGVTLKDTIEMATQPFPVKFAHFVVCASSLILPAEVEVVKIAIHRARLLEESLEHLSSLETKHVRSNFRIDFVDESGIDAGGVHREWFMQFSEKLVDPGVGLFASRDSTNESYYLNPHSKTDHGSQHLAGFYATGRLVGRALLDGEVLGFQFALPLLKIMLGYPLSLSDLEFLDADVYKGMQYLLEHEGAEALGLDFTVTEQINGETRSVELIPDGAACSVTDTNKHEYVRRRVRYLLVESVSTQLYVFLKGLYEVVPPHLLMLFDPEELNHVLSGSQDIDVTDWERHSRSSPKVAKSRVNRWFWDIVRDMPNEYRKRLLQFSTGRSQVPLVGFQGLTSYDGRLCPFSLRGISSSQPQYIHSHACFNRLDLPLDVTRLELKAMLYAILDTDVLGFTID